MSLSGFCCTLLKVLFTELLWSTCLTVRACAKRPSSLWEARQGGRLASFPDSLAGVWGLRHSPQLSPLAEVPV